MDGSTSTKTNGLEEYFALWYSNADTGTKACTSSMGQSNAKMMIGVGLYLLMKLATSCFAAPFVDGHEIQVLKSNEFPKTSRRLWYGEASASRASLVIIPLKQLWMAPTTFKIISFLMQEDNLVDDGDCNRIMILNMQVDLLSNSCLVKYQK